LETGKAVKTGHSYAAVSHHKPPPGRPSGGLGQSQSGHSSRWRRGARHCPVVRAERRARRRDDTCGVRISDPRKLTRLAAITRGESRNLHRKM